MTPRWLLFFLFIGIVAVLGGTRRNKERVGVGWKALSVLPKYTRVTRDHVHGQKGRTPLARVTPWESIAGKYTLRQIESGETIALVDLSEAPKITHDNDHRILAYSLKSLGAAAILLNAGSSIAICEGATKDCVVSTVAAVTGEGDAKAALLELTTDDAFKLGAIKQPLLRITSFQQ